MVFPLKNSYSYKNNFFLEKVIIHNIFFKNK